MCCPYITHKTFLYFILLRYHLHLEKIDCLSADLRANEPEVPGKEKKKNLTETLTTSLCQGSVIS